MFVVISLAAEDAVSAVIHDAVVYMPFAELVDIEKEKERLAKEKKRLEGEIKRCNGMLNNPNFVGKAPEAKIAEEKEKLEKYTGMLCLARSSRHEGYGFLEPPP